MPRDWRISPHSETVFDQSGMECGRWACRAPARGGWVGATRRSGIAAATVRTGSPASACAACTPASTPSGMRCCGPKDTGSRRCSLAATGRCSRMRSAAAHWGIRQSAAAVIDVTAPHPDGSRRGPGLRIHCGARLRPDEVTVEDVVPCTTVASHAARSGGRPPRPRTRRCHRDERAPRAAGPQRRRDAARPSSTADAAPGGCAGRSRCFDPELLRVRSETEARFYCLCVDAGLPRPLVNRPVGPGRADVRGRLCIGPPPG